MIIYECYVDYSMPHSRAYPEGRMSSLLQYLSFPRKRESSLASTSRVSELLDPRERREYLS